MEANGKNPRPRRHPSELLHLVEPPDDDEPPRRSRAVIGLILMAVLVVAAVYLVHALREESQREDCLMEGRTNCAPISIPGNRR
jgi:hypothetical protein